jgi:beta-glucanase (GH16 family)
MRAKFPKSLGMWPAFWLMGVKGITDKSIANPVVDVVEQYGSMPNTLMATLHTWGPGDKHWGEGDGFFVPGMTDDFHTYGALVEDKEIVIYYDGVELWRQKTAPEFKVPLYIMVDLAMGGGWPIDKAVSPSYMYVDYVRAYARK